MRLYNKEDGIIEAKIPVIELKQIHLDSNDVSTEKNYLTSVSLKKTFKVSINKQISVIPSNKKYEWNWLNDKRVINTDDVNEMSAWKCIHGCSASLSLNRDARDDATLPFLHAP
jgi:hypothetical protein